MSEINVELPLPVWPTVDLDLAYSQPEADVVPISDTDAMRSVNIRPRDDEVLAAQPRKIGRIRRGLVRIAAALTTAVALAGVTEAVEPSEANATPGFTYTVTGTDGDGVWLHTGPGASTDKVKVLSEGSRFQADCYSVNTVEPVGPRKNPVYLHGTDGQATGYFTDFYSSSRWDSNNTLQKQGLPICGESNTARVSSSTDFQPAATPPSFASFSRDAATKWALAHATDTPPNAGSCTWFASQVLWAGGLQRTPEWNDGFHGVNRAGVRYGTDKAWVTPDFVSYLGSLPYVKVESLGRMSAGNNNVPDAKPGDIISYDWEGDGSPDHISVVTGSSGGNPAYPLVSGWSEDGSKALRYRSRGWTWSENHHEWLQNEPGNQNMTATLFHIRNEDEVNIGGS